MRGPKAPKDPTKKRPCLYMMLDKALAGVPAEGGAYRDTNFMEGRLVQQVKGICGDVDEEILKLLENAEGLKKLIHSVGIAFTSAEEEGKSEDIEFHIHFYGKTNKYSSGTYFKKMCPANGEEVMIPMEEIGITEEDDILGAFLFEFPGKVKCAKVTLKFYLNDGYEVPEIEVDPPIKYGTDEYQKMIERSVLSIGNTKRLKKAINKAKNGEDITIAYIGGSITQGAGAKPINTNCYAYLSYKGFLDLFTNGSDEHVTYVKAGVGGTPSELGMIRYDSEVTLDGERMPDILFVEFAVNDEGDETKGVCFESLIRKIANAPNKPAVIINFAVFMNDWNLEDRLVPVGENYDIPMVSVKAAVVPQFTKDTVITKRQYFYDIYHPTNDGHRVMADCIIQLLKEVDQADESAEDIDFTKAPVIGANFENVILMDRSNYEKYATIKTEGYDAEDTQLQHVEREMDLTGTAVLPNLWAKDESGAGIFNMTITCKNLLLVSKDSGDSIFGKADVYVDDKLVLTADPLVNGWNHVNPQIILDDTESKEHKVRIQMHPGDEKKRFTILGFGVSL